GGDAFEPADGDRLLLEPSSTAGGLARAVAGAPKDSWKHVRLPVDHVGVVIVPGRDLADVFRDRRVGGAGPLTIDDSVEVFGIQDVSRLHDRLPFRSSPGCELVRIHSYASLRAELLKSFRETTKGREVGSSSLIPRQARPREPRKWRKLSLNARPGVR